MKKDYGDFSLLTSRKSYPEENDWFVKQLTQFLYTIDHCNLDQFLHYCDILKHYSEILKHDCDILKLTNKLFSQTVHVAAQGTVICCLSRVLTGCSINEVVIYPIVQKCSFCRLPGALVGCHKARCPYTYHLTCGLSNGCLMQYYDNFR